MMIRTAFGLAFLWLMFVLGARAQETGAVSRVPIVAPNMSTPDSLSLYTLQEPSVKWYDMFKNMPSDWARFGQMSVSTENISLIIGLSAMTGALIATDDATWKASDEWYQSSNTVREASDIGEWIGHGVPQFGLAGAFAAYGLAAGDNRALRTASQTTEAILACGVVVQVLKHVTGRESPVVSTRPGGAWRFFPNQIQYHKHVPSYDAYPSGHIATALATVTVIAENYPEASWIRPVGYVLITWLGVSMANTGIHWYSDYPLGLALGYTFGMLAAHPESLSTSFSEGKQSPKLSLLPRLTPLGGGVQFAMFF